MTPDWAIAAVWFVAGVGATSAFWYFLGKGDHYATLWTGCVTALAVVVAVTLHIRNGLVAADRERAGDTSSVVRAIGQLIEEGSAIQQRFVESNDTATIKTAYAAWNNKAVEFLKAKLSDPSYSIQFAAAKYTGAQGIAGRNIEGGAYYFTIETKKSVLVSILSELRQPRG